MMKIYFEYMARAPLWGRYINVRFNNGRGTDRILFHIWLDTVKWRGIAKNRIK